MLRISFFNYSLIKCVFAKFFGGKSEEESEPNIGVFLNRRNTNKRKRKKTERYKSF